MKTKFQSFVFISSNTVYPVTDFAVKEKILIMNFFQNTLLLGG